MKKALLSTSFIVFLASLIFTVACKKETAEPIKANAPQPDISQLQYTYNYNSNTAVLGRVLFYDKNLSLNNTISCGSCHKQEFAFADNKSFSVGLNNQSTARNALTIINTQHNKFWDGRAGNFDTAVFMPVQNHLEMGIFSLNILPARLSELSYYPNLFKNAYGTSEINVARIRQALSDFLTNFVSNSSKYDQVYSGNSTVLFTGIEQQGKDIFFGKGTCYNCHNGNDFAGYGADYENIGLDVVYADQGRGNITKNVADNGRFLVPTLRNIALTAPYMHDGRYKTLSDVINHYSDGIQNNPNLSWEFRDFTNSQITSISQLSTLPAMGVNLTNAEKKALEAFLNTLTDVTFITDPKFSDPFR